MADLSAMPHRSVSKDLYLIKNGKMSVNIVVENNSAIKAASFLKQTLAKMAESSSIDISNHVSSRSVNIFLRRYANSKLLDATTDDIDITQKFKLAVFANSIYIEYPEESDAYFAVSIFLRKYCKVYFLVPSEIGTEIPKYDNLKLRKSTEIINPSYKGRYLGVYANSEFVLKLGSNGDFVALNHALPHIVNKNLSEKNPEWLAEIDDKRQPYSVSTQVDFNNSSLRLYLKNYADAYFKNYPNKKTIAFTPADSSKFDTSRHSNLLKRGRTTNGYADYSNLVFSLTNDIARHIGKNNPSKFVYALAYLYTEMPPSIKLENNIILYLCEDRGNFFSEQNRSENTELLQKWKDIGIKCLGVYDYNYGKQYFIPRNIYNQIADSIKSSYDIGARFYTGESYPNWAYDAHKIWLIQNLLLDVNLDAEKLKKQFFEIYYKESAVPISEFFDIAQHQWDSRSDIPMWLTLFKRFAQAEIFTDESISKMESKLVSAESIAKSETVKSRIKEIRMMFNITKAFINTYKLEKKLWKMTSPTIRDKSRILDLVDAIKISKINKMILVKIYENNTKYPKVDFSEWEKRDYIDPSEMRLYQINSNNTPKKNILKDNEISDMLKTGGSWHFVKSDNANFQLSKLSGDKLKISSWLPSYFYKSVKISPNKSYILSVDVSGHIGIGAIFYIELAYKDKDGRLLAIKRLRLPPLQNFKDLEMSVEAVSPVNSEYATVAMFAISMRDSDYVEVVNLSFFEHENL